MIEDKEISIYDLHENNEISTRLFTCLFHKFCGPQRRILYLNNLSHFTENDLTRIHYMGEETMEELKMVMEKYNLSFVDEQEIPIRSMRPKLRRGERYHFPDSIHQRSYIFWALRTAGFADIDKNIAILFDKETLNGIDSLSEFIVAETHDLIKQRAAKLLKWSSIL